MAAEDNVGFHLNWFRLAEEDEKRVLIYLDSEILACKIKYYDEYFQLIHYVADTDEIKERKAFETIRV